MRFSGILKTILLVSNFELFHFGQPSNHSIIPFIHHHSLLPSITDYIYIYITNSNIYIYLYLHISIAISSNRHFLQYKFLIANHHQFAIQSIMNQTFFLDQQIVGTFGNCQVIYSPNPYVQPLVSSSSYSFC